ncbi:hypothetical protein [Stutzerimonas chloritidismutans]
MSVTRGKQLAGVRLGAPAKFERLTWLRLLYAWVETIFYSANEGYDVRARCDGAARDAISVALRAVPDFAG